MAIFELTKPLNHGIETIRQLDIKEPTFAEIKKLGLPILVESRDVDMGIVFEYVAALAALPPPVLDQMCARDVMGVTSVIVSFFGESEI